MSRVLITGAARGIGRAIALACHEAGRDCVLLDCEEAEVRTLAGQLGCQFLVADLAEASSLDSLVESTWPLGGLVNNAGIMIRSSILETHLEDWDRLMAVNLRAPFALMKACAKRWIEEMREGRIVNISSGHAVLASRNRAAYAAAKAGLESVTRNAAFEWGKQGVKVFAVAPGFTWTEMSRGSLVGDRLARVESRLPSGKVAEATEVAKVVISYLSGDLDYTAGHTIRFDGGWTNSDVDYSS